MSRKMTWHLVAASAFAASIGVARAQQPAPAQPAPAQAAPAQAAPAQAAPAGRGQGWEQPCKSDVVKLCADVVKANGNVPACLGEHEKDLSEECTNAFLYKWKVAQLCKDDIEKLCKDKLKAGMKLGACFKENEKSLSEKCRNALVKGSKTYHKEEKAAAADEKPADDKTAEASDAKPAAKRKRKK